MSRFRQEYMSGALKWFVIAVVTTYPALRAFMAFCQYLRGAINV